VAEIPIRRKEGRNVWPLLLGLIVLAVVLWFVVTRHSASTATAVRADSAAVRADSAALRADSVAAAQSKVTKSSSGGALDTSRLGKMDTSKLGKMDTATRRKASPAKKAN
jgi:hypothetical protein